MKQNLFKKGLLMIAPLLLGYGIFAQNIPTLELTRAALPTNFGFGTSLVPMTATFQNDALNSSVFTPYTPTQDVTVSFRNQQFTGLNYGTVANNNLTTTGLVFGAQPSLAFESSLPGISGPLAENRYNVMGAFGGFDGLGPTNAMYTSNPTATGAQLGTGIKVVGGTPTTNGAFEVFTAAQVLFGSPNGIGSRVYFGDVVLTFNNPVKNPVIHINGMGGSYRYLPVGLTDIPANYLSTFFTSELELQTPGVTSDSLSGNEFFRISGNNILNRNNANPNGASVSAPGLFDNYGASSGSVRINGTVQELVYRVYLKSGTSSQFAWSVLGTAVNVNNRNPFTGDVWYIAASFDKPALQVISGTVFNDADGLADGNISQTLTSVGPVSNPTTNAGGTLFANLLNSAGLVVASTPIAANGAYLFDNVPVGTYTVQLTRNASAGTYASPLAPPLTELPVGWANTGEFNGIGAGSDGSINGLSAPIVVLVNDIKSNNNFGIERLPDSKPFNTVILTPNLGESIALTTPSAQRFGSLPILTGSDPEDQPTEGVLTGKSVKFTTLATVGSTNTPAVLLYNGVPITLNQVIPNFNSALLTVSLPNPWAGSGLRFNYAYVDAADLPDPTPALYQLRWSGGGPLVINLSEFVVTKNNCTANLNWKTSSEVNSDRFEVQVSTGANPVYTTVSTVLASGSSSTTKSYQFTYQMQSGVTYYFRLKMIDKDGTFTYSNIQSANCLKGGGIVIAPNPVKDMFTVKGMENGKNTIIVYAANGQLVQTQTSTTNNTVVNIAHLAPGMYTVKVTSEAGNSVVNKLIKY